MRLFVTGARGFVGFAVTEAAVRRGWDVCGIGRSTQPPENWSGQYCWADVAHSDLTPLINGFKPDIVFHGAGSASVEQSFATPVDDLRASVLTFANLLDAIRRSRQRPAILFPSSAAVYGNPSRLPISESAPTKPISPYGFHKLQCEILAEQYRKCFSLKVIVCRLFSLFGPRQKRLLLWELFQQFTSDKPFVQLQGTGEETRDYLSAGDAASAMMDLAAQPIDGNENESSTINIASGEETSVFSLALTLRAILGSDKSVKAGAKTRLGDPVRWQADVTRLKGVVTTYPLAPLEQRLLSCVEGFRATRISQLYDGKHSQ
jgi:UDP-glucose 4-epimerase